MKTTTYYNLNIVDGTDVVNPLIVDNPNYEKIDEAMHDNAVAGVTFATEITNATVHAIARENSDCAVIRFIATSEWKAGDTVTVDGVPVTALLPSGETLPDGAYVINANVLCILTGTNLTIFAERKKAENANEIAYNDTTVGAELTAVGAELTAVDAELTEINRKIADMSNVDLSNVELLKVVTVEFENTGTIAATTGSKVYNNINISQNIPAGYVLAFAYPKFAGDTQLNITSVVWTSSTVSFTVANPSNAADSGIPSLYLVCMKKF